MRKKRDVAVLSVWALTDCHTRGKAVRIKYDIWSHAWFCKRHILNWPFLAEKKKKYNEDKIFLNYWHLDLP